MTDALEGDALDEVPSRDLSDAQPRRDWDFVSEQGMAMARLGTWSSPLDYGEPVRWSRECARLYGLPEDTELTVDAVFARIHPDDRVVVRRAREDLLERNVPLDVEHRIVRPDGTIRWAHAHAILVRDREGRPSRIVGATQDVTEQRSAIEARREAERLYRRVVETTSEGVWIVDADMRTTFVNRPVCEMLGRTQEEILSLSPSELAGAGSEATGRAAFARRREGAAEQYELKLRHKDGHEFWVSISANPMFDPTGRFEGAISLMTDITARHRVEEERARLAAIVESSHDAIVSHALDGTIVTWNAAAERIHGWTAEEAVGKSIAILTRSGRTGAVERALARLGRGEAMIDEDATMARKDGRVVDMSYSSSPLRDAHGTIIGASVIARDFTLRRRAEDSLRRAEDQLRQAQKMEAIGALAGGVAHDFNNLLFVMLTFTSLVHRRLHPDDPARQELEQVRQAAEAAATLTRQLLAFSRRQALEPRVLTLESVIGGIERMMKGLLGGTIALSIPSGTTAGRVFADAGQIEQVVMNLIVNARDAMPNGGRVEIATDSVEVVAGDHATASGVAPGAYVRLSVSDTGTGIDASVRERIFEPFFTTKEAGKGTGLGLSTVYGIVRQSGGYVVVKSQVGRGTTVEVYLPRTDRPESEAAPERSAVVTARGSETILVVEDDALVRESLRAVLRQQGYDVLEAQNAGDALLACEQETRAIDLLITDLVMPRMGGVELARRLAALKPTMKVLYMSGRPDGSVVPSAAFVQKPATPEHLLRKIRELLEAPAPP